MPMKEENKGCLILLAFLAAGIVCICIGLEYDIHILYVLGFLLPAQSGRIYNPFKGKDKNWSPRKQIIISLITLLIAVSVCFILYGKLW